MGWLLDAFAGGEQQRALVAIALLGCACGPLGVWIVAYRQAYAAESLAHALLPGLLLASLAGVPLAAGAAAGALLSAGAIGLAGRDPRVGTDSGVAVAVTGLVGTGGLLALVAGDPHELEATLFGDPLGVGWGRLSLTAAAVAATVIALAALHRRLAAAALDPTAAPARARGARLWVLVLLALATVVAAPVLGNLLVVALLVAPGAAAARLARGVVRAQLAAAGLAATAGVAGLAVAHHTGWEEAACVALAAAALYPVAVVARFVAK